jgi:hypothetical protein
MADWYYAKEGRQHGPVSSSQLRQMAQSGELLPEDLVFKEGSSNWIAASTVQGLFPSERVASRAAPPPSSRPEPTGGSFSFEAADEDAPVARSRGPARKGGYWGDVLMFRRMIAPWVIMVMFWIGVIGTIIGGLVFGVMGILAMVRVNALAGLGMIFGALIGVPLWILAIRLYAELAMVLFRISETLTDIREMQEKQGGKS